MLSRWSPQCADSASRDVAQDDALDQAVEEPSRAGVKGGNAWRPRRRPDCAGQLGGWATTGARPFGLGSSR